MLFDRSLLPNESKQLRAFAPRAQEGHEIGGERLLIRAESEDAEIGRIAGENASVRPHDEVARERFFLLALTERIFRVLALSDIFVDEEARRFLRSRSIPRETMTRDEDRLAVSPHLLQLAFPMSGRAKRRLQVSRLVLELRLKKLMHVSANRLFPGPAVNPL